MVGNKEGTRLPILKLKTFSETGVATLYFLAVLVGFAVAIVFWYITSRWVAFSVLWAEDRYAQAVGPKAIKTVEIVICGLQVLISFALAIWVGRLMVT